MLRHHNASPLTACASATVFHKALIQGKYFYAKENKRVTRRNSYTVSFCLLSAHIRYGLIERFLTINGEHFALIQELQIHGRGPPIRIPDSVVTAASQALLFEDYLTVKQGPKLHIFAHQIRSLYCNLATSEWNLITPPVNSIELE